MTKELYVISRDVKLGTPVGKHTGYMLVEKDSSGKIISVKTVDLYGGPISDIKFAYGHNNGIILPDGSILPSKVFVDGNWIDTDLQWAKDNHYKSALISDLPNAGALFEKIEQNAKVIDKLRDMVLIFLIY